MSYHSVHMQHAVKGGYRKSKLMAMTIKNLKTMTWEGLRTPSPYLNGNTKWQEFEVIAFFFKNGFNELRTSRDIGYYIGSDVKGGYCLVSIRFRLTRVNPSELLTFGIKLMRAGLLKRQWKWLLDPYRKNKRGAVVLSKHRIIFSKAICEQAIKKYGTRTEAARKLKIKIEVLEFWLNE